MDKKSPPRMGRLGRLTGTTPKRESSKRRWGTLIEAAKTGRVRRLMNRSRSQDSMCSSSCPEGSTRSRRGGMAERGDSRDDEEDEDDDPDDEDEMVSLFLTFLMKSSLDRI